ncbi:type VII secretion-associated serine protease mycosin [Mycobacterium hubeiense]|uniref:type VII secretion-associated serine protease mycosin n=1 Tax=Mycobacterium hubeiense TaxID=1867256 RepID=UPI000C7F5EE4|nr:type VII secretion-associated serine protease mycosin [Mycobacterium sp. QGD 101]
MIRAVLSTLTATFTVALVSCPSAGAIGPPQVDASVAPPSGNPGPVAPMAQRGACTTTGVLAGSNPGGLSPNQQALNLSEAWQHSRGEGQVVAVIDTGVQPGPRLPNVDPGGDFVEATDGLTDCDGHGTLVAGLIAGQPGDDEFSGVAPAARLISIRQTSAKFAPQTPGEDPTLARAAADVVSLARAVVRAADLGARVINISAVTCLPANKPIDQAALGAALKYAAVDKDAVIVAAAGNNRAGMGTGSACESNPLNDASRPDDPRNWSGVTSVSVPSWWQPYVLSVGSLTPAGQPSEFTMAGPWLGIAAPGENITSVSNAPNGGLANGLPNDQQELFPISGTSYAAAYVSGVAALVRSKFPHLNAEQVMHRLTATAHDGARSPSNLVGAGSVDPVAALTWEVPAERETQPPSAKPIAAPPPPAPRDLTPRTIAFAGTGALALVVLIVAAVAAHRRKDKAT